MMVFVQGVDHLIQVDRGVARVTVLCPHVRRSHAQRWPIQQTSLFIDYPLLLHPPNAMCPPINPSRRQTFPLLYSSNATRPPNNPSCPTGDLSAAQTICTTPSPTRRQHASPWLSLRYAPLLLPHPLPLQSPTGVQFA